MKQEQKRITIAFLLAHPDDEHIPFGLPAQLSADGHTVHLVAVSDGSLGSHTIGSRKKVAEIRKKEFSRSARLLGANDSFIGIRDGSIHPSSQKQKRKILRTLREIDPDVIILPNSDDYHDDHVKTNEMGKWAAFHLPDAPLKTRRFLHIVPSTEKSVAVYEADTQGSQTWQSLNEDTGENTDHLSRVNLIVQIGADAIEKSIKAFEAHQSQLSPRTDEKPGYVELATLGAQRRGRQGGFAYGAGLTFIPFGGYAFSTHNVIAKILGSQRTKPFS